MKKLSQLSVSKSLFLALISLFFILGCETKREFNTFGGFIQGTTYSVIYEDVETVASIPMRDTIEFLLHEFDMSMSIYEDSSVVSLINRNEEAKLDEYFLDIFSVSKEMWRKSDGAFDITVAPLVNAYGFGRDTLVTFSDGKRDSLMQLVGFQKVDIVGGKLVKENPGITLDFNAIAQGYSVDLVADFLEDLGIKNYLVEIGGEIRAGGTKNGQLWRVGVDRPVDGNSVPGADLQAILRMKDIALSTSGNYRKFYIENGVKYSHTIDPKTGSPARNTLLSATIIAPECAVSDAIATICMVIGKDKAINFIESQKGVKGYFIYSDDKGNFKTWISKGLEGLIDENL